MSYWETSAFAKLYINELDSPALSDVSRVVLRLPTFIERFGSDVISD